MSLRNDKGFTFIELTIASLIVGLAVLIMMPSLQGYQADAQVRAAVTQAVDQFREAETQAIAEDVSINVRFYPSDTLPSNGWQGWEICIAAACGNPGSVIASETQIPSSLHMVASCYRGQFSAAGNYTENPCGSGNATIQIICVDAGGPYPYAMDIIVQTATGQMTLQPHPQGC